MPSNKAHLDVGKTKRQNKRVKRGFGLIQKWCVFVVLSRARII